MNNGKINFTEIINLFFILLILCGGNSCSLLREESNFLSKKQAKATEIRTPDETINDQRITSTLKDKLKIDSSVSGLNINVDTYKSEVTLQGAVHNPDDIILAVKMAQSVSGVKRVRSQLIVNN